MTSLWLWTNLNSRQQNDESRWRSQWLPYEQDSFSTFSQISFVYSEHFELPPRSPVNTWQNCDSENKVIATTVIRPLDDHTYCARSAFTHFGVLVKTVRLFIASLHNHPMCAQRCSTDSFVDFQPVGWNFTGGFFNCSGSGLNGRWGSELGPFKLSGPSNSNWHVWSISYRFWVTWLAPKAFSNIRLPIRPGYDHNYHSRSYCFDELAMRKPQTTRSPPIGGAGKTPCH